MTREQLEALAADLERLGRDLAVARDRAKEAAQAAKAAREHVAELEFLLDHKRRRHAELWQAVQNEQRMSGLCAPVWITPPAARKLFVANIEGGQFVLIGLAGPDRVASRWWIRTGYEVGVVSREVARLDGPATLAAWRAWCAAQRQVHR